MKARLTLAVLVGMVLVGMSAGGCAASRHRELERVADRVETHLRHEQSIALANGAATPDERQHRLDHLTGLRYTLSGANVALGSVPRVVPAEQRPLAYDVLEEVYATIDWNIPLGPGNALRPLPAGFAPATGLNLSVVDGAVPAGVDQMPPRGVLIRPLVPLEE